MNCFWAPIRFRQNCNQNLMTAVVGVVWFSGIRQSHSIKPNPHSPDEAASTCGNCESRVKTGPLHREKSSSLVTLFLNFLSWSFTWHMKMWNSHAEKWHWHYSHFTCRNSSSYVKLTIQMWKCVKLCHLQEEEAHFRRFVYTCGNSDPDVNKDYTWKSQFHMRNFFLPHV